MAAAPAVPTSVTEPKPAEITEFYDAEDVAEETVVEPTPEPAKPKHNPRIVTLAEEFGVSPVEMEAMSPQRLSDLVDHLSRRAARETRSQVESRARDEAITRTSKPAEPAEPVDDFPLEAGVLDPKIEAFLRKLHSENKELKGSLGQVAEREQVRERQRLEDILNDAFDGLSEYGDRFGKGSITDLPPGSPELLRRQAVFAAAKIDFSKRPGPKAISAQIKAAAEAVFGKPVQTPPPPVSPGMYGEPQDYTPRQPLLRDPATGRILSPKVGEQIEQDWATATQRPTARAGAEEPTGKAKATRNLAARMAEQSPDDGRTGTPNIDQDFL